jgi:hypothetical protein
VFEDVGTQLEVEEEGGHLRKLVDPKLPTQDKVDEHYLRGHVPYRNWCPVCIRARGKDMDHQKDSGKERKVPEYSWDYCFPGDELGFKWTGLVGRERGSKSWMATALPAKGSTGRFGVDKCLDFFEENGDSQGTVLLKSDQEPAIELLMKELVEARPEGKTILEGSPKQSKGSNGVVERAAQELEGGIRSLFLGLEERLERNIDARERIVAFMPDYASYLVNRLSVGQDGLVAYERIKGKKPTVLGLEFGEKLAYMKERGNKLSKLKSRWGLGIFVGVRRRTNEIMVANPGGIVFARAVKRLPKEKRWGEDSVNWVVWAPWNRYKDHEERDGDLPDGVPVEEKRENTEGEPTKVYIDVRSTPPTTPCKTMFVSVGL